MKKCVGRRVGGGREGTSLSFAAYRRFPRSATQAPRAGGSGQGGEGAEARGCGGHGRQHWSQVRPRLQRQPRGRTQGVDGLAAWYSSAADLQAGTQRERLGNASWYDLGEGWRRFSAGGVFSPCHRAETAERALPPMTRAEGDREELMKQHQMQEGYLDSIEGSIAGMKALSLVRGRTAARVVPRRCLLGTLTLRCFCVAGDQVRAGSSRWAAGQAAGSDDRHRGRPQIPDAPGWTALTLPVFTEFYVGRSVLLAPRNTREIWSDPSISDQERRRARVAAARRRLHSTARNANCLMNPMPQLLRHARRCPRRPGSRDSCPTGRSSLRRRRSRSSTPLARSPRCWGGFQSRGRPPCSGSRPASREPSRARRPENSGSRAPGATSRAPRAKPAPGSPAAGPRSTPCRAL